jgi:hypothetical protein
MIWCGIVKAFRYIGIRMGNVHQCNGIMAFKQAGIIGN